MSAGGLSYDGLTTSRRATLPSVEMWSTNMNILRDPKAGIYTRRVDKVSDTQGVLLAQDNAGDRIAECINVYARGVNPMVSVSYDNNSNNAGLRGSLLNRNQGVKLPYRPEVYRPPVLRQEDLMPLSRQPRNWFYALANPELPNVVQNMQCNETKSSTVDKLLRPEGPPSYRLNVETPVPPSSSAGQHTVHQGKKTYHVTTSLKGLKQGHDEYRDMLREIQKRALHENRAWTPVFSGKSAAGQQPQTVTNPEIMRNVREEILRIKDIVAAVSKNGPNPSARDAPSVKHSIHLNKPTIEMLTQRIRRLENMIYNAEPPLNTVHDTILRYATPAQPGLVNKILSDHAGNGGSGASACVREDRLHAQMHTQPTSRYVLDADSRFCPVSHIIADNRFGEWVVGNRHQSFQGKPMEPQNTPAQASKAVKAIQHEAPCSVPTTVSSTVPIATSQNVRDISPLDVTSVKTLPTQEHVVAHDTLDRLIKHARPVGHTEVNPQYHTKTMLHTNLSSGTIEAARALIEAQSHRTYFDKTGDIGTKRLDRRALLVENMDTLRNIEAHGNDLYDAVQSTKNRTHISHRPAAGAFHGIGNAIPRMDRVVESANELPIDSEWTRVKREAHRQHQSRFE